MKCGPVDILSRLYKTFIVLDTNQSPPPPTTLLPPSSLTMAPAIRRETAQNFRTDLYRVFVTFWETIIYVNIIFMINRTTSSDLRVNLRIASLLVVRNGNKVRSQYNNIMCTNHSHCKYYNYNNLNCSFPHTILKFLIEVWYLALPI